MNRCALILSLVGLIVGSAACATDPATAPASADDAASVLDLSPGGAADESGFPVIEVGGSGRFGVDVAPLAPGVSPALENLRGVAHAFRLRLEEAASVAFIARTVDGDVDPYVVLESTTGEKLAVGRD